ncbi:MAG: hypothetical protein ABIH46_11985 [Chloroflexota bacterium]
MKTQADKAIEMGTAMGEDEGRFFLQEKLGELARRRADLEREIEEVDAGVARAKSDQVRMETVREALTEVGELYGCRKPFEQKELTWLILRSAEVGAKQIVPELYRTEYVQDAQAPEIMKAQSHSRFEPPDWLPKRNSLRNVSLFSSLSHSATDRLSNLAQCLSSSPPAATRWSSAAHLLPRQRSGRLQGFLCGRCFLARHGPHYCRCAA